jgi:hypothetical protein
MKPQTTVILTTGVVVAGHWADGEVLSFPIIIGGLFLATIIATLGESQPELASGFAYLILVGAVITYVGKILKNVGLSK